MRLVVIIQSCYLGNSTTFFCLVCICWFCLLMIEILTVNFNGRRDSLTFLFKWKWKKKFTCLLQCQKCLRTVTPQAFSTASLQNLFLCIMNTNRPHVYSLIQSSTKMNLYLKKLSMKKINYNDSKGILFH